MTKTDLAAAVAEKTGLSKKDAEKATNAVFGAIADSLVSSEKVQLVGFGTFEVHHRAQRKGRNPRTKQEITIPESDYPVFKAGKSLKDAVSK